MTTAKERCMLQQEKYHSIFSDIPTMTSNSWITKTANRGGEEENNEEYILIDVRSKEERDVSVIPGSISLQQFEDDIIGKTKSNTNNNITVLANPNLHVVTYCTIGYRSGVEARRLRDAYNLHERIHNLDGIVPYTHCCLIDDKDQAGDLISNNNSEEKVTGNTASPPYTVPQAHQAPPRLISPKTGEETNKVHCYGSVWAQCLNTSYFEPVVFTKKSFIIQSAKKMCEVCCRCSWMSSFVV